MNKEINITEITISRRQFLKIAGVTAGTVAVGGITQETASADAPICREVDHLVKNYREGNNKVGFQPNSADVVTTPVRGAKITYSINGKPVGGERQTDSNGEVKTQFSEGCDKDVLEIGFQVRDGARVENNSIPINRNKGRVENTFLLEGVAANPTATTTPTKPVATPTPGTGPVFPPGPGTNCENEIWKWSAFWGVVGLILGGAVGWDIHRRRVVVAPNTSQPNLQNQLQQEQAARQAAETAQRNAEGERDNLRQQLQQQGGNPQQIQQLQQQLAAANQARQTAEAQAQQLPQVQNQLHQEQTNRQAVENQLNNLRQMIQNFKNFINLGNPTIDRVRDWVNHNL